MELPTALLTWAAGATGAAGAVGAAGTVLWMRVVLLMGTVLWTVVALLTGAALLIRVSVAVWRVPALLTEIEHCTFVRALT